MEYTTVVGKTGQITLPSKIRRIINATPGSKIVFCVDSNNNISVNKQKTATEIFAALDQINRQLPNQAKQSIQKNAGKTASTLHKEWLETSAAKQELKEKYGS